MVEELEAKAVETLAAMSRRRKIRAQQALDLRKSRAQARQAARRVQSRRNRKQRVQGTRIRTPVFGLGSEFNPIIIIDSGTESSEESGDTAKTQPYTNSCAFACDKVLCEAYPDNYCGEQESAQQDY